jgi:hypothetical protein
MLGERRSARCLAILLRQKTYVYDFDVDSSTLVQPFLLVLDLPVMCTFNCCTLRKVMSTRQNLHVLITLALGWPPPLIYASFLSVK